jgi:hypothetical protein
VSIDSATLSLADLTLLGDSFLRNGSVGLTRETGVPSSSAGSVLCTRPVAFRTSDAATTTASFAARFSFLIADPSAGGDGVAFFLSPDRTTLGATGGYLGLFNSAADAENGSIVAVEFDTTLNPEFGDPSDNHVGLDLGSPASVATADLAGSEIDLKSGNLTTAWIDYRAVDRRLEVFLSYAPAPKPARPVLSVAVDLDASAAYYVGFSASTEGTTQTHTVKEWTFRVSSVTNGSTNAVSEQAVTAATPQKKRVGLALCMLGPVALAAAFIFFAWVSIKKLLDLTSRRNRNAGAFSPDMVKGPKSFSYKELSAATRGFHASRVIGKGAFGTVYKATMPGPGAATYAVDAGAPEPKRVRGGALRHRVPPPQEPGPAPGLVRRQGRAPARLRVHAARQPGPRALLLRPQHRSAAVAAGVASVLAYLHQECERRVIHRVKTSNVLLDAGLRPRLGDFGLARLVDHGTSPASTLTAGTMGYLAHEYLQSGKATEQTDVFSYGVVVLEVCCGLRPIHKDESAADGNNNKNVNLVDWVWRLHGEDRLIDAADARLAGEFDRDEMTRLLLVGLACANPDCDQRPAMRRVVQILSREADPPSVPRKKPLLIFSSSASMKLQEMPFACGDDVRGGYAANTATSPKSEKGDIER